MKALDLATKQFDQAPEATISRPHTSRSANLPIFKLPFTNTKANKPEDSPLLSSPESATKTPRPKVKLAIDLGLHSHLKLESQPKSRSEEVNIVTTSRGKAPKLADSPLEENQNKHETMVSPLTRRVGKSQTILIKMKNGCVVDSNSPFLRIPVSDLYNENSKGSVNTASVDNDNPVLSEQSPVNPPCLLLDEAEEEQYESTEKDKASALTLCSTMESSGQLHGSKGGSLSHLSLASSPADQHRKLGPCKTLKDIGIKTAFNSPKSSSITTIRRHVKVRSPSNGSDECASARKSSKAVNKIAEACEKAKLYNDQVILQHQFEIQDEEEERDFCELYEMLQSNVGDDSF